jgi:UDPglucose--hexose-1-phosphate uridylyltransferase
MQTKQTPLPGVVHRRYNPLKEEWVLVSPHRCKRPWLGEVAKPPISDLPTYDPKCFLCPNNSRAVGDGGVKNPNYTSTFVFDNDFSALLSPEAAAAESEDIPPSSPSSSSSSPSSSADLFISESEFGLCRVVCFSPSHDSTLPELSVSEIVNVLQTWAQQTTELETQHPSFVGYVQVFENKGEMMGCSNPHPHSQIWATSHLPTEIAKEQKALTSYREKHLSSSSSSPSCSCLLCSLSQAEKEQETRIVEINDHWLAIVPFWAVWPFETLVLSKRHVDKLSNLTSEETEALAQLLKRLTTRYDNLYSCSFPYSMGFHQSPAKSSSTLHSPNNEDIWHLHAHFYPPLLRSSTVKKHMVGFEMLAMAQRDLTPELAAARLRDCSPTEHYKSILKSRFESRG